MIQSIVRRDSFAVSILPVAATSRKRTASYVSRFEMGTPTAYILVGLSTYVRLLFPRMRNRHTNRMLTMMTRTRQRP